MPIFKVKDQPVQFWLPRGRIVHMEDAPGHLSTIVRAWIVTTKGEGLGTFEVEGRCETIGRALDAGAPDSE